MKTLLLSILLLIFIPTSGFAQPQGSSNQRFAWDQPASTLTEAQSYTYKYYADGSSVGVNFSGVVCTGAASPFLCTVNIPAFSAGNHSVTFTASNLAGESAKSSPFVFVFVVIPGAPIGIRIQ